MSVIKRNRAIQLKELQSVASRSDLDDRTAASRAPEYRAQRSWLALHCRAGVIENCRAGPSLSKNRITDKKIIDKEIVLSMKNYQTISINALSINNPTIYGPLYDKAVTLYKKLENIFYYQIYK